MTKTIIAPIIAFIAVVIQLIFGITIPEEVINQVTFAIGNLVAVILVIHGIFKNHGK